MRIVCMRANQQCDYSLNTRPCVNLDRPLRVYFAEHMSPLEPVWPRHEANVRKSSRLLELLVPLFHRLRHPTAVLILFATFEASPYRRIEAVEISPVWTVILNTFGSRPANHLQDPRAIFTAVLGVRAARAGQERQMAEVRPQVWEPHDVRKARAVRTNDKSRRLKELGLLSNGHGGTVV
eukprot:5765910-Pleurochrysis_carterae.AAC.1